MTTPADQKRRGEIRSRLAAATPKWSARERGNGTIMREFEIVQAGGGILFRSTSYGNMEHDAALIAGAPSDLAFLEGLLAQAEARLARLRAQIDGIPMAFIQAYNEAKWAGMEEKTAQIEALEAVRQHFLAEPQPSASAPAPEGERK